MALLDPVNTNGVPQSSEAVAPFNAYAVPTNSSATSIQSPPALRFRDVRFTYSSELESVHFQEGRTPQIGPVNWDVSAGSFTLLLGNTGAGKTTLLRICKPEITPAGTLEGSVDVFGASVGTLSPDESACTVGYVAQSPENQLVCDSVWHELAFGLENLGIPQQTMRKRVAEVAHFFGIEPWFHRSTSSLSGGQKQLLNLASVLVMRPRILLLDEPTAQLDPVAEKNFLHALFRLNRELGITVVVATHRPEVMAAYATAQFDLSNGCAGTAVADLFVPPSSGINASPQEVPNSSPCHYLISSNSPVLLYANSSSHQSASTSNDTGAKRSDAIKLKDVFFRYEKDSPFVLRSCDVRINAGSIHAIVGGNGSGKSTLLNVMAGCIKPERGIVENTFASNMALLPQDPTALFACDSVADEAFEWLSEKNRLFLARNDVLSPFLELEKQNRAQNKKKTSFLRKKMGPRANAQQHDIERTMETGGEERCCPATGKAALGLIGSCGLENALQRNPLDLSGGQRQLLALAKVLLAEPSLLLLDEPTKGLDVQAKCAVANALIEAQENGITVVMATHDLAFASRISSTTSMLFDGGITCTQSTQEFFEENYFYRPVKDAFYRTWVTPHAATQKARSFHGETSD